MACCGDSDMEDAPSSDKNKVRGCTDVFWLVLYISLWFLMILIAGFALVYGNPRRLVNGYDSFGNTCGSRFNEPIGNFNLSGLDMTSKRYLFFMDVKNLRHSLQICVEKCPDRNLNTLDDIKTFYEDTGSNLCRYDYNLSMGIQAVENHNMDVKLVLSSPFGPCPVLPVYKSSPVLNRCVPVIDNSFSKQIVGGVFAMLNSWDTVEQVLGDLYATWHYILALSFVALFLSLTVVLFFYVFPSSVAYIIMLLVSITTLVGTSFLWWTYFDIKSKLDSTPETELLDEAVQNERAILIYSFIATIIMLIILLLVYSMRRRVDSLAILFKEAADCLSAIPSLYLQPVICFIELIAFYIFWVSVVVCLATANYPGRKLIQPFTPELTIDEISSTVPSHNFNSSGRYTFCNGAYSESDLEMCRVNISVVNHKAFTLVQYADATWVRYMWWVYLISLVWTSEFLLSCQQMVISGAVARSYFNGWKKTVEFPVLTSFCHLIFFHLGSAALGSLLITVFKLPRIILTYIHAKLKREDSLISKYAGGNCACCTWSYENFIRYINHNAYTVVAMQGINFCPAAERAFHVLANNTSQLATMNTLGDFVLFLGKVIVTAITSSIGLLLLKNHPDLHFYSAPTLVICIFSYFIAHSVISLYEIVIDTFFLCVCEDENMNGGTGFWRQSTLSAIKSNNGNTITNPNVPELSPINS